MRDSWNNTKTCCSLLRTTDHVDVWTDNRVRLASTSLPISKDAAVDTVKHGVHQRERDLSVDVALRRERRQNTIKLKLSCTL